MAEYKTQIPCTVYGPEGSITTILELTLQAESMIEALGVLQSWFSGCSSPVSVMLLGVPPPPEWQAPPPVIEDGE